MASLCKTSCASLCISALLALLPCASCFQISLNKNRGPIDRHLVGYGQNIFPAERHAPTQMFATGESDEEGVTVKNVERKDIAYDETSGKYVDSNGVEGECEPNDEFCVVDKKTGKLMRLTLVEKERIFLDALQSYYVNGRQILNDSEFDLLKEDLAWSGSPVANLNRKEAKYLNAMQAFSKGDPIISDEEFDVLKKELKEEGSQFAVSTEPKCYIDTGICTVTLQEDKFRSNLLYLPAGAALFILWLGLGFEIIEPIIRINPVLLILLGSPFIYVGAKKITEEYIFEGGKIAYGPCPICEVEQRVYFGNILGVEGYGSLAELKCSKCKDKFQVQKDSLRASTLPKF